MKSKSSKVRRDANYRLTPRFSNKFVEDLKATLDTLHSQETGEVAKFSFAYLREELLSKYLDDALVSPSVRAHAAIQKWMKAELMNAKTNVRLTHANASDPDFGWTTWTTFVDEVQSLTKRILGPLPDLTRKGMISNRASTRVSRSPTAALEKLKGQGHVSSSALHHLERFWADAQIAPRWTLHETSTMFTVPKKSDIDRVACKEPEFNMLLQRIAGVHIRTRLRRKAGINLQDQTRNQLLAREGSRTGALATIDLSSASDSISSVLVQTMLPAAWWSLLDDLRVKATRIPFKGFESVHTLEMFSSMGNGFTFELESLIFYAIVKTIAKMSGYSGQVISVYGDDIICPSGMVPRVKRIFDFIGFKMNAKKTFASGPFRESCGKHYYNGFDVSPFYIKEGLSNTTDLIRVLNQLLEWDGRDWGFFITPELAAFHKRWARYVPRHLHGGVETSEIGALVTGDYPRKRIVPRVRPLSVAEFQRESYLLWHLVAEYCPDREARVKLRVPRDLEGDKLSERLDGGEPVKVFGYRLAAHAEYQTGVRTTWRPYLIYEGDVSHLSS